jgi:hypothetical protein
MAYYPHRHGNQTMAFRIDRIPETHGRIMENFIIETPQCIIYISLLRYLSLPRLLARRA